MHRLISGCAVLAVAAAASGCTVDSPVAGAAAVGKNVTLQTHSVTPALLKAADVPGLDFYPMISSDDTLPNSPDYRFGGSADGMGVLKNGDGYTLLVNHEDNFAVSRLSLDRNFRPTSGEYLVNSNGGMYRLCSATMATPAEHGFGPVFITAGESNQESMIHGINPLGPVGQSNVLPALGRWNAENAVPLPKESYEDKTVIVIGDDDSGPYGGQLALYVAERGNLQSGRIYVLARTNSDTRERNMTTGVRYPVEFREITNYLPMTGLDINIRGQQLGAIAFGRVEDIDYRKSHNGREVYFCATGQNTTGANADYSRTKYGRIYRLEMNPTDPTRGTLEVILDGDDRAGVAGAFQNPDNICVTRNYVYIQEDPNGYGDEVHDAYVYQYDINKRTLKVALELDHRRSEARYNIGGVSKKGSWEYGALVDVSEHLGNDVFALCIQPHTWRGTAYKNPDGGTLRSSEDQASQIVLIKGLPR